MQSSSNKSLLNNCGGDFPIGRISQKIGNPSYNLFNLKPVIFNNHRLKILDQTKLPNQVVYRRLRDYRAVAEAIKTLQVRGAPLIGITAAFGLALEANKKKRNLKKHLIRVAEVLKQSRPTAVNLAWALDRCLARIKNVPEPILAESVTDEAEKIYQEETMRSLALGEIGARLVKKNSNIITICNTGKLAAPGLGTALAVIYTAFFQKKNPAVYVCETRPLLQGARLTMFELVQAGIPATLITDNMVGAVVQEKQIDMFLVGADRIAGNGDTANKIGTLTLAIIAHYYQKPFYVVAPVSSFDLTKPNGAEIPIELRDKIEVTQIMGKPVAPQKAKVYNPAFDITPNELITAFITDKGIVYPPFHKNICKILKAT